MLRAAISARRRPEAKVSSRIARSRIANGRRRPLVLDRRSKALGGDSGEAMVAARVSAPGALEKIADHTLVVGRATRAPQRDGRTGSPPPETQRLGRGAAHRAGGPEGCTSAG